jgi:hypothetical protein
MVLPHVPGADDGAPDALSDDWIWGGLLDLGVRLGGPAI